MNFQEFYQGRNFDAYTYLGAHPLTDGGYVFRTFAPGAEQIEVIGEWNGWQGEPMERVYDGNFWEFSSKAAKTGMMYKYKIHGEDGSVIDHCDPYGYYMEVRPGTASRLWDLSTYTFHDDAWLKKRSADVDKPLNIYEMHFGSWRRKSNKVDDWYSYNELADELVPYLKEQGYNYIEILPLTEHPVDESWGYQNTAFFAPTSRYGSPTDLMAFIDTCHKHDIGVIMDFVTVHFAVDDYGLRHYDGTALYEYPSDDVQISEWGSCNFMHARPEVRSFLQANADYWLSLYHFDGLRFDAVSRLLYWQGDEARGENRDAIKFLKTINSGLKRRHPSVILAAEDSTNYPGVTAPVPMGGLGFDYKWDLGWMHDTLELFQTGPEYRARDYHKLTFSMQYFYNERYLLPLSHDEVVHGKATIAQKMYGDYDDKFPQARTLYVYMMTHPGKKLLFMGSEFAQLREWDEKREQDWLLLDYPVHDAFRQFMADLAAVYHEHPALWEHDYDRSGFAWIDCHEEARCIYVYKRMAKAETLVVALNLSDHDNSYHLAFDRGDQAKSLVPLIVTDDEVYSGTTPTKTARTAIPVKNHTATLMLPRFSAGIYQVK